MLESLFSSISIIAFISFSIAMIFTIVFIIPLVIYSAPMYIYFGYKGFKYYEDYHPIRECRNATRIYKALLTGKDTVELL